MVACVAVAAVAGFGHGAVQPASAQPADVQPVVQPVAGEDEGVGPAQSAAPAEPVAAEPRFDIVAFDVSGVTLLDARTLERTIYPFTGPGKVSSDVDRAREALEKAFQDRGFQSVAVEIPPQNVDEGVVQLRVVEAPIGQVRVTGARHFSPAYLKRQVASLKPGTVPDFRQTSREIAEANRMSGRQVTPILRPGRVPGTLDVELKVQDQSPFSRNILLSNDHARDTPDFRLTTGLRYENLWQRGHTVSLTYVVAPQNRSSSEVISASYMAPLWGQGWTLLGFAYKSNNDVATLGGVNVLGRGYGVGLRAIGQLLPDGDMTQQLTLGVDLKHSDQTIRLGSVLQDVTIEYMPISASWGMQAAEGPVSTQATLGLTFGVQGWGDSERGFSTSRFDAKPGFTRLNFDLDVRFPVGKTFSGKALLRGQLADMPLVSTEQISLGGHDTVRGFLQSEAVGDHGLAIGLEVVSPPVQQSLTALIEDLRAYAFVEGGRVVLINPTPDQDGVLDLASVGLGTRFEIAPGVIGDLAVGFPIQDADGATRSGDVNAVISLKSEF